MPLLRVIVGIDLFIRPELPAPNSLLDTKGAIMVEAASKEVVFKNFRRLILLDLLLSFIFMLVHTWINNNTDHAVKA